MPWRPLPRIAFAVATFPFQPASPADLPLELGDELYIIEQGGKDGAWYRGYLVAPPSLLSGLTSVKGQTLEARVFSGIFPKSCVEVRELLGGADSGKNALNKLTNGDSTEAHHLQNGAQIHDGGSMGKQRVSSGSTKKSARQGSIRIKNDTGLGRYSDAPSSISQQTSVAVSPLDVPPRQPGEAKPPAPVPMLKIGDETPTSASEPLVDEIASCLREWHSTNLHELLLARQYGTLEKMSDIVGQLDLSRKQLLHDVLTAQERSAVREQTVWNLVKGNKMLGGEVIVRDPNQRGRLLTGDDSAIEMTRLQAVMGLLESNPKPQIEAAVMHHLLFELKAVTGLAPVPTNVTLSLYLKSEDGTLSPLSETYSIEFPPNESFANLARSTKLKTLFADLGASDIGEKNSTVDHQIYLLIKVQEHHPPKSRQSLDNASVPSSREGPPAQRNANAFNTVGRGSVKAGRRSLMFGARPRVTGDGDRQPSNQGGRSTPIERASSRDRLRTPATGSHESAVPRTVAVAVLEVGQILRQDKEVETAAITWSPAGLDDEEDGQADQMDETVAAVLHSPTGRYLRSKHASRIHVRLVPHASPNADDLIQKNPTSMHMVTKTNKIGFSEAPTQPRSDIYLTISEALIPQGAMLAHPESGQVPLAKAGNLQNLQLTMEVRNASGKRIDDCIFPSSNSSGHTAWRTNAAEQGSRWDQTVCLKIPPEEVPGSHLIMSMANAPEFPFALSWVPLWDQNAFIRDGHHSLLMHAYDKSTSSVSNGKGAYLSLPWNRASIKDENMTGPAASLVVESYLCSTEYSQDPTILSLINWRMQSSKLLLESLKKIIFVPEIEVVKQMRDVFDALFAILVHKKGDIVYEDLIFNDIVTILGIVHDRRFHVVGLVDRYADFHFNYPFATTPLLKSYNRLLNNASDPQAARSLRATFKVGRHILKFIMKGRTLQKSKEANLGIREALSTFNADVLAIFSALEKLMRNQSAMLIGSKTLVVQHFHTWIPELLAGFERDEVIDVAVKLVDAAADVKGKLILYKLILIQNYIQLDEIFATPSERQALVSHCLRWLSPHWGFTNQVNDEWKSQVRLCSAVVAELTRRSDSDVFDFLPKTVESYCAIRSQGVSAQGSLSLLFPKSFPFPTRPASNKQVFDETLLELSALMATISPMSAPSTFSPNEEDSLNLILSMLQAHRSVLDCEAYPASWLSLHVYHHRSILKSLEYVAIMLTNSFLPSPDYADTFDMEIWKAFFATLLKLVTSNALALETFAEQKRRAVWKIAGDVRENGASLLRRTWESIGWESSSDERRRYGLKRLGGFQVQYVPGLIPQIMELCLSVHESLRRVAVEIMQTMIVSEWALSEDLSLIETEMIASLDVIFKTKKINESILQKLFIGELLGLFETIATMPDDALWIALKELVATVDELMDLLVNAHAGTMTESLHTLRLMEFMKDMQKEDIFIRYVHELADTQQNARNPAEAGLALQTHAELYDWDPEKLVPALEKPAFPEQTAFERKEALYFHVIQLFEDGKSWNNALKCYAELADQYENAVFDFAKLARTQRAMGKIHEAIAKDDRHAPKYFCVTYLGLGFPAAVRDKEFVFEGLPAERMSGFTDRMQKQYPSVQIVTSRELEDIEGQYLLISNVSPHRDVNHPVFQRAKIPQPIREHLLSSNPIQFSVTSKRQMAGTNIGEQWTEKTVYTTTERFPTILKRSEIVSSETVRLPALPTAIERTWRKTGDLLVLERRVLSSDDQNNAALTETLNQLLDTESTTQTCMAHYRQLLSIPKKAPSPLNDDGDADLSDDEGHIVTRDPLHNALVVALSDHVATIKRCLTLYTRPSLQATGADLTSRFEKIYAEELRHLAAASAAEQTEAFPFTASPPRVSLDAGGKITIDSTNRNAVTSHDYALSASEPRTSFGTARASRDKSSRVSLQFLKGATHSMKPSSNRPSKESERRQSHSAQTLQAPSLQVNGFHGAVTESADAVRPHEGSLIARARKNSGMESQASGTSKRSRSRSQTRPHSIFGGSASRASDDDHGKASQADGLGASLRAGDGSVSGATEERPITSGSSQAPASGSQSSRGVKKRFSLLNLGRKKSGGDVRVSEVLEE